MNDPAWVPQEDRPLRTIFRNVATRYLSVAAELQAGSLLALPIGDVEMARTFSLAYPRLAYRKLAVEAFLDFCRTLPHGP